MRGIFGKTSGARRDAGGDGFLCRLKHDTRGNVLAMMAAALIPFCGLVGGGIDLSRMYITKTRLQHACDAGALAGRKKMGSGTWSATDGNSAAVQYFDANFSSGLYGSTGLTRSFAESAGKVTGTSSATLPMTLMRVLGKTTETLTVTCDAEMRLPNTDIMFVLDTTGSMASKAVGTDTDTKIQSLKTSVKCFYEIVARIDTDATCTTGTPSGGTGNQVQIRFGFVPYSMNVNVGKILPTSFFADTWDYQTRVALYAPTPVTTRGQDLVLNSYGANPDQSAAWQNYASYSNVSSATCTANKPAKTSPGTPIGSESAPYEQTTRTSGNQTIYDWKTRQRHSEYDFLANYNSSTSFCQIQRRYQEFDVIREYRRGDTTTTTNQFSGWRYAKLPINTGLLKNGTAWRDSFQWPIGGGGANRTINWDGCVEERPTVRQSTYTPIPSDAFDLNIDLRPAAGTPNSLWGPALHDVFYARNIVSNVNQASNDPIEINTDYFNDMPYGCPAQAKKLQAWTDATAFDSYVDGLTPVGNTYHDIGMLWGARLMSPTGIFATENAFTPQGGEIDRNMIFMTDGDAQSSPCDYTAYGVAWWDQRTTTDVGSASNCGSARAELNAQVNARLDALCTAVKNKNITLWVISFGSGSNTATETRLAACATTGRYFAARDSATLQSTFASIANQISQLRLTR